MQESAEQPRSAWLRYASFYACSFFVLGAYMQFFPTWLHEVAGFRAEHVAVILSAQKIARTLAGPLWSQWVDRTGDARRALLVLTVGAIGAFACFWFASSLALAWAVAFLFGCLFPPVHNIFDAAAVRAASEQGFSFGRLRMIGSASFLVVILVVGVLLTRFGTEQLFGILLLVLSMAAVAAWFVPRGRPRQVAPPRTKWWQPLRSKTFVLVLLISAAIQGSHALYYDLSTVHWNGLGIDKTTAAVLWGEGVLAEVVLLFFARHTLERLQPSTLLVLGGLAAAVRWAVIASTVSVPLLLLGNWLHALSFAATYLGAIHAVRHCVPEHLHVTAQGLLGAANAGVGMAACGLIGAMTYRWWQGAAFYVMSGIAVVGVLLATGLHLRGADRSAAGGAAENRPTK